MQRQNFTQAERKRYFIKDKKAQIYKRKITADSAGIRSEIFIALTAQPIWCYARQVDADIFFRREQYQIKESYFFIFNNRSDIKIGTLILYRDKWYEATRVDTQEDYKSDLYVYAKDLKPTPTAEKIRPYGYEAE